MHVESAVTSSVASNTDRARVATRERRPSRPPHPRTSPILASRLARPTPTREENVAMSEAVVAAEVAAWRVVLSADPEVSREVVAAHLPAQHLATIDGWLAASRRPRAVVRLREAVDAAAEALPDLDPDAVALRGCLDDMRLWGLPGVDAAAESLRRAVERMEVANLRLVSASAAWLFRAGHSPSMTVDDLIGYGMPGLRVAVMRYRAGRGTAFSTFAVHWIRSTMRRSADLLGREIHVAMGTLQAMRRLARVRSVHREEPLDDAALAAAAKVSPERLDGLREVLDGPGLRPASLDGPAWFGDAWMGDSPSERRTQADSVADDAPSPLEAVAEADHRAKVRGLLRCLDEREQAVVTWRFNLDGADDGEASLRDIGAAVGLSGERVRQVLAGAMAKLHREATRRGLSC